MKRIHNRNPLMLCLIGGLLMISSGASGAIGTLAELAPHLGSLFGTGFALTFDIIMGILAALTLIGGVGVIVGGVVLTTRFYRLGRVVVILCIVMGVTGLIMSLIQLLMAGTLMMGLSMQLAQSVGWIGAIFSLIAQTIAEQPSMLVSL
ncbi:MAG: hypothetical protein ACFFFC_02425 [Candidatus Thorarchaeota archaeon]